MSVVSIDEDHVMTCLGNCLVIDLLTFCDCTT